MKKIKLTRYVVAVFLVGSLALGGFLLLRPKHASAHKRFDNDDARGRYISAENAADTSSVHNFTATTEDGGLVGPAIPFATTAVMIADGRGNVCGEADGFYSGISAPGVNLGPALFHGTYTVDPAGRITILTCSDGTPSPTNTFCGTSTLCAPVTKAQVGYLQNDDGRVITTVEQTDLGTDPDSSGFLVHHRVWTKAKSED